MMVSTGRTVVRTERILQLPNNLGWLNKDTGRTHKSAWHAKEAVKRREKARQGHKILITIIEWEPINILGTAVVKALDAK